MERLPGESAVFAEKKQRILRQLSLPEAAYTDASPKGSVDEGIRQLIDDINGVPGFVTTSSCAGRISVFVEGRKSAPASAEPGDQPQRQGAEESTTFKPASSSGGKGGGGRWLFVSHEPVQLDDGTGARIASILGLGDAKEGCEVQMGQNHEKRLIHFKFEPMILHVHTASLQHAQLLLKCAIGAGFRESGATGISPSQNEMPTPMAGIRSMGLGFESLIGVQVGDEIQLMVTSAYLKALVAIGNQRFQENSNRIQRFRSAFLDAVSTPSQKLWEDADARRARKKEEGLRRREELRKEQGS